jgi:hypothetical protein
VPGELFVGFETWRVKLTRHFDELAIEMKVSFDEEMSMDS